LPLRGACCLPVASNVESPLSSAATGRSWPTTAAHRLELKCAASDVHGKGHALRPPFRDWGLSTRFAALHRDPTVALRPQCLRGSESGPAACAARAADAGAERSDGPKGC